MASKLHQLKSKAIQASQFVGKHGSSYYRQMMEQNKHYVKEPPTVETCNELSKQLFYTRLASIPGRTESFWKELDYVKNLWKNRQELRLRILVLPLYLGSNASRGTALVKLSEGDLLLPVIIPENEIDFVFPPSFLNLR